MFVQHFVPAEIFDFLERFQNRATVGAASPDVVDLRAARILIESLDEPGDVQGVNVVAHLFALVAVDFVKPALEVAFDQVAEKSVQLDPAVIRTGKATAAQATAAQAEVSSIFLNHDVAGDFGGPKETVLALIDRQIFTNTLSECGIVVVPTRGKLPELDGIRAITVHLVGAHVDEDGLRRVAANGFKKIESSTSIDIEIIERTRGGQVVAG